ncbi:MAG: NUDIX hydrolase [Dermatophilaceae bacterium]
MKRRDNGKWEPPGGFLELDETIEEGVRREVREEAGAEIEIGPLTGACKNMTLGIVALVFRAAVASASADQSQEAAKIEWVGMDQARQLVDDVFYIRLTDAQAPWPGVVRPAVRTHDGRRLTRHDRTEPE